MINFFKSMIVVMLLGVAMPNQINYHRVVPDVPTGYVLNPEKGPWGFATSVAEVKNYITNPSAEVNTDGWFSGTSLFTRPTVAYRGRYSLSIDIMPPTSLLVAGAYIEPQAIPAGNYNFGFAMRSSNSAQVRLQGIALPSGRDLYDTHVTIPGNQWTYIVVPYVLTSLGGAEQFRFVWDREDGIQTSILIDAMILTPTTREPFSYFDGDAGIGYYWTGTPGLSQSFYTSVAGGGQIRNFDDFHFYVEGITGAGMPTLDVTRTDYAAIDGGNYQGTRATERYIGLVGRFQGATPWQLDRDIDNLIRYFNRDMTIEDTPLLLVYQAYDGRNPIGKMLTIKASYVDGLEGTRDNRYSEKSIIRFRSDDPFFYEFEQNAAVLTGAKDLASVNYIIQADRFNNWGLMGTGTSSRPTVIRRGPNGFIYVAGFFASAGGVANTANFAYWNGTGWVSAGIVNGPIHCMELAPNGDIYVGGNFTSAGGVAVNRIARYRPSTNTWAALGVGVNAPSADSMAISRAGILYVGGSFTTAGGIASAKLALWDINTSTWSAPPGGQPNDTVFSIVIDQGSNVYIGGVFTSVASATIFTTGIAKLSNAGVWSALSSGLSGGSGDSTRVRAMAVAPNGILYAGGNFTTAGGVVVNHIGQWTGTAWRPLDIGLGFGTLAAPDRGVYALAFDPDGILHVGGRFASAGRLSFIFEGLAKWNGSAWILYDLNLPGTPVVHTIFTDVQGTFIGFDGAGTVNASANTNITVTATVNTFPILSVTNNDTVARRLYQINNETTNESLWFDLPVQAGETITIDLTVLTKSIWSTTRGDLNYTPLQGSQTGKWHLAPNRTNIINVFMGGAVSVVTIRWNNAHWSTVNARY
jgi:hypothetical protein